jgi:hypothetical protein
VEKWPLVNAGRREAVAQRQPLDLAAATTCQADTLDPLVAISRWQLSIGLGALMSLLLVWDREIQGKDRCGDRGR